MSRALPLLIAHLGAYGQLLARDAGAALAFLRRLVGAVLLFSCLAIALVVATSGVVIAAAWFTSYRWPVIAAVIILLVGGCLLAARLVRSSVLRLSNSFDGVRTELQVDAALLQRRFGTPDTRAVVEEPAT
jgi:uncharacterized membrane protein YqjE